MAEPPLEDLPYIPDLLLDDVLDVPDGISSHAPHLGDLEPTLAWLTEVRHGVNTMNDEKLITKNVSELSLVY